jgi:hypothetical protein
MKLTGCFERFNPISLSVINVDPSSELKNMNKKYFTQFLCATNTTILFLLTNNKNLA